MPFFAGILDFFAWFARTICLGMINRSASLEALGRSRPFPIGREFSFPHGRERSQVDGGCGAIVESEYLSKFEIKDVACVVETSNRLQTPASLQKQPADTSKQPRALEAQILSISHPLASLPQHPKQCPAAKRRVRQRRAHFILRQRPRGNLRLRHLRIGGRARNLPNIP